MLICVPGRTGVSQYTRFFFEKRGDNDDYVIVITTKYNS